MERVALAVPSDLADRLDTDLRRHGHDLVARCADADELAVVFAEDRTDFAIVAAQPRYLDGRLVSEADAAGVRMIAVVDGEADRRYAVALGLYETVDATSTWSQIESAMLDPGPSPAPPSSPVSPRGQVIAVWGPAGSPGRTTLAISIAAELAAAGCSVALADVDTHSGSVAPAIGLLDEAPGFAAACRLAGADSLTREQLDRIAERYLSRHGGFRVLTGIGRPSRWP